MEKSIDIFTNQRNISLNKGLSHLLYINKGLTQAQLSEATGISRPYISDLVNGAKKGKQKTWEKIAAFFKMSIQDIYNLGESLQNFSEMTAAMPSIQVNMTASNADRFSNDPLLASIKIKLLELEQRNHQKLKEIDIYLSGVIAGLPATARA